MATYDLDIEQPAQLVGYLRRMGYVAGGETVTTRVLTGGVSNRTVLIEHADGTSWVLKQALERLRVAVEWLSSPERIHREAEGLRHLVALAPPATITPIVFEDQAQHVLAMQAVPQPHENWKTLLLDGRVEASHIAQFGRLIATVHRRAFEQREIVEPRFLDRSFFESLRIEPYYRYTALQVPAAAAWLSALIDDTDRTTLTLVHGDYSPKNILVHDDRLILLDHEVIHWGDPAFDLGFSLTHLLSKAHHIPAQRSTFLDGARYYWQVYQETLGELPWTAILEARAVRHTLACLLARVAGRSPLEYMSQHERSRQRKVVLDIIPDAPPTIAALIDQFGTRIGHYADDHLPERA